MNKQFNEEDVRKTYRLLGHEKETEIRIIHPRQEHPPISKYPSSEDEFVAVCGKYNGTSNIYVGVNERRKGGKKEKDVIRLNLFVVDIDPDRPKGTSASDEQVAHTIGVGKSVCDWFESKGFLRPSLAMTQNGVAAWARLPPTKMSSEEKRLIKKGARKLFEQEIRKSVTDSSVNVDPVHDLSRIMKVAGTLGIKGDVHRVSKWIEYNPLVDTKLHTYLEELEGKEEGTIPKNKKKREVTEKDFQKKRDSRSEKEWGIICSLIEKGLSKEQVFKEMRIYAKWSESREEYREHTYKNAKKHVGEIPIQKQQNPRHKLVFRTSHLPHFEDFKKELRLIGPEYIPVMKGLYYSIAGICLKGEESIRYGKIIFDTRLGMIIFINSGGGKNNMKQTIKSLLPPIFSCPEISSLYSEQLIGTVVEQKNPDGKGKIPVPVEGYLANDANILDEARQLFISTDSQMEEIRAHFCRALDPIGLNEIYKQLTRWGSMCPIRYFAHCTPYFFSQPCRVDSAIVETGLMRRCVPFYVAPITPVDTIYGERLSSEKGYTNKNLTNHFDDLFGMSQHWVFEDIFDPLKKYASLLHAVGMSHKGKGAAYVNKVYRQYLLDMLLKLSCISATLTNKEKRVTTKDVENAYTDMFEFLHSTLEFVDKFCADFYTFQVKAPQLQAMQWLYLKNYLSEEMSNVMIKEFQEYLARVSGTGVENGRVMYYDMKDKGLVATKKGQHDSKVWLTEMGVSCLMDDIPQSAESSSVEEAWEEYLRISESSE